jgi:hypothetical protein
MPDLISDEERERMAEFATTPKFRRRPEQLLPEPEEEEE